MKKGNGKFSSDDADGADERATANPLWVCREGLDAEMPIKAVAVDLTDFRSSVTVFRLMHFLHVLPFFMSFPLGF